MSGQEEHGMKDGYAVKLPGSWWLTIEASLITHAIELREKGYDALADRCETIGKEIDAQFNTGVRVASGLEPVDALTPTHGGASDD